MRYRRSIRMAAWPLWLAALALASCGGDHGSAAKAPTPESKQSSPRAAAEVGPASEPASAAARPDERSDRYPNSLAVLAHSGATGEDSDPDRPGVELRANSWATGTNPAVNSVYLRVRAHNPAIEGHNFNLAQGGATVDDLVLQAEEAVALEPKPELILLQIMDNDIVCPATARDYAQFRSTFISALDVLAKAAPESSFFVVSQFGSPTTYWKALSPAQRSSIGGTGPCAFLDPDGRLVPKELRRLERIIHDYEAQLEAGCERFRQCRYDRGAFGRVVDRPEYITPDLNHFSVQGHAKAAAVAWAAMKRVGLVPRSRMHLVEADR